MTATGSAHVRMQQRPVTDMGHTALCPRCGLAHHMRAKMIGKERELEFKHCDECEKTLKELAEYKRHKARRYSET